MILKRELMSEAKKKREWGLYLGRKKEILKRGTHRLKLVKELEGERR